MASYLDPRPTDVEIIEAIRYHFPIHVQRVMLGTQLRSISEALDLLRRVELMEEQHSYQGSPNGGSGPQQSSNRPGYTRQGQVRHIQYHQGTGIRDNEVPDATTVTEGETKIRGARDRKTLHPGMPQRPLSEDREGRVQKGLMEVIIRKTNFRRD
jgi:hypothetical protein